ncbi:hypothetical protein HID58_061267 [Brassica napus]|uniref:Uncharacterized protein n=1 Tax=Brassica napus TaxID=3708 RepID=A0ABQ7ZYZ9_BRANA|nr:hypothetical protein HID58_061267 [Brassica napus]
MAHEQKPKSDEAKSLCADSIRETEMQKSVCRFHWLGFDQSFRLLSIHLNEIASGSIAVNKIKQYFRFKELVNIIMHYPQGNHGIYKDGRPIYIKSLGQVIPRLILIHINEAHDCWIFDNGIGRCPHIKSVKVRYVVPTGALVGIYEDLELRDGGSNYLGKIQDPTQQTDIDNFMVPGVMEPKTSWLVANCILSVCKAGVIDSLSMAFSLQSEGRRAKEPKPMSADSFENYNQEEKERLCNNYFYVALSEK